MSDARPAIVAAVIVFERRVLLVRRRVAEGSLVWQFPAGEQQGDETVFHTAVREVAEEVGITVRPVALIGERRHPVTDRHMIYVGCQADSGAATVADTDELAELAWCDRATVTDKIPAGVFEPVAAYLDLHLG